MQWGLPMMNLMFERGPDRHAFLVQENNLLKSIHSGPITSFSRNISKSSS